MEKRKKSDEIRKFLDPQVLVLQWCAQQLSSFYFFFFVVAFADANWISPANNIIVFPRRKQKWQFRCVFF